LHSRLTLTYREKKAVARAAVSHLKGLILSGFVPASFLRYKFEKATQLVFGTQATLAVCKIFDAPIRGLPYTIGKNVTHPIRLFVDIEGTFANPLEVTLLFASGKVVVDVLHLYGVPTAQDKRAAPFCHCIFQANCASKLPTSLKIAVQSFLQKHLQPSEIVVNGVTDIHQFFNQFLDYDLPLEKFLDIGLPEWASRPTLLAHQLAVLAKERCQNPPPLRFNCNMRTQHGGTQFRRKASVNTLSQLSKSSGCHCSLYDVMELFYYVEEIAFSEDDLAK